MAVLTAAFALDGAAPPALERGFAVLAMCAPRGTLDAGGDGWRARIGLATAIDLRAPDQCVAAGALFDGWIDDRADARGDATLLAEAWARWGERCFERVRGGYSTVLVLDGGRTVVLARDATGQRPLFFRREGMRLFIASSARAVAALAGCGEAEDAVAVAHYFALLAPPAGRSFFAAVEEVPAGTWVRIDAHGATRGTIAAQFESRRVDGDDATLAARWHDVLAAAVGTSLADAEHPGVSLSGGLDSSTIATLAAEVRSDRVAAYSWSLPGMPSADERRFIEATVEAAGLTQHIFEGDALWPLVGYPRVPLGLDAPSANSFRALKEAQYAIARADGCDVLLSGHYGDHVYPDSSRWLVDALRRGRLGALGIELLARLRRGGLWREQGWRAPLRRLLRGAAPPPDWLTSEARAMLAPRPWPPWSNAAADPPLARELLSLEAAHDASGDTAFADRAGVSVRYPYRDPRVIEFVLGLPVDATQRLGQEKALTRRMLAGHLPDAVRLRPKSGSLAPFHELGVRRRERAHVEELLFAADARAGRFIDVDRLRAAWFAAEPSESDDNLVWLTLSYELWRRSLSVDAGVLTLYR